MGTTQLPSTWVRSTLSGYIGGGPGGIGSVTWGRLQEAGTIKAVDLLTVEQAPHQRPRMAFNTSQEHGSLAGTLSISARMMQAIGQNSGPHLYSNGACI